MRGIITAVCVACALTATAFGQQSKRHKSSAQPFAHDKSDFEGKFKAGAMPLWTSTRQSSNP